MRGPRINRTENILVKMAEENGAILKQLPEGMWVVRGVVDPVRIRFDRYFSNKIAAAAAYCQHMGLLREDQEPYTPIASSKQPVRGGKRVYVAGAYNGQNVMETLDNIRIGIKACIELIKAGYCPYCPWVDFQLVLMAQEGEIPIADIQAVSMAWLEASEAMIVVDNPRNQHSKGLEAEVKHALMLDIPIFYGLNGLVSIRDWVDID